MKVLVSNLTSDQRQQLVGVNRSKVPVNAHTFNERLLAVLSYSLLSPIDLCIFTTVHMCHVMPFIYIDSNMTADIGLRCSG
jgi:hypothetical protein